MQTTAFRFRSSATRCGATFVLAYREVINNDEAFGQWTLKFGKAYANNRDVENKWHLGEVLLTMNGCEIKGVGSLCATNATIAVAMVAVRYS